MDGLILAIDLGKFNSMCCWYDPAKKATTFRPAKTTEAELGRELTRQPVSVVVIEAGSGPLTRALTERAGGDKFKGGNRCFVQMR